MPYQFYKIRENNIGDIFSTDGEIPANAFHSSVYGYSHPVTHKPDITDKTRLIGNWVGDIDHKPKSKNPTQAEKDAAIDNSIKDAKATKAYLCAAKVPLESVALFISGGKGFHIVIPSDCFSAIPLPDLPSIYGIVARKIEAETGVKEFDKSLFNNYVKTIRCPNMRRANGHYKVQISWDELDEITPENYFDKCAAPRDLIKLTAPQENRKLMDLYLDAIFELKHEAEQAKFATIESADLALLGGQTPTCFKQLAAYENISVEHGGWNNAKQTAARGYVSGVIGDTELELIAQNFQSTRNPTPAGRLDELKTLVTSFAKAGKVFGCGYMLQILDKNPCKGCPLKQKCGEKQTVLNLINKVSSSPKHIAALIKAIKNSTGDERSKLGHTLCKSLAKGTPAKRSVDDAVAIAVANGVDEQAARGIVQGDVDSRTKQVRAANKITDFEGLQRVNVDGLSHDKIADLLLNEIETDRYFAMLLGETETVEVLVHDAYEHDDGSIEFLTYTENRVQPVTVKPKVFLMNLPMAAGKTTVATKVHSAIQNKLHTKFLEYKANLFKRDGNKLNPLTFAMSATITAHRTSLIKGLSERFNVANYQLIENKRDFTGSFATCVDSLPQFKIRNPFLIVDEAKQTLEHLTTSETAGSKSRGGRTDLYANFKACYESAIYTILLDADMDDLTVEWFRANGQGKEFVLFEMMEQAHQAKHTILTGGHDESRHKIIELLERGKRGVVACTSEIECLMSYKWLKSQGFTRSKANRILVLTGSNKGDARQAAFLANPTKESERYDLIIHSPVIGSGVSLENPNLTFSILMNTCVVPSNEALQMLGRNRCATDIFVSFGKPSNFYRVTDPQIFIDAEKERIAENHFAELNNGGFELESGQTVAEYAATLKESALTRLQAQITAKRNADLNDYENNLVLLAQLNGRTFDYSGAKKSDVTIKGLRDETIEEIVTNTFHATPIDAATLEKYELETALTQEQSNELKRFRVCEMAGTKDIDSVDVENHLNGDFSIVTSIESVMKPVSDLQAIDATNRKTFNKQASKVKEQRIFNEVFAMLSDQTFENYFKSGAVEQINLDQKKAVSICKILKKHHKELSGRADYSKIPKDAVRSAKCFLKKYGFKKAKSTGKYERNYTLFFDDKIALYVNNRAGLVGSS